MFLWPTLTGPGRQSNGPTFWIKYFYETRLSHESLEPLIAFLEFVVQTLWPIRNKQKNVVSEGIPGVNN